MAVRVFIVWILKFEVFVNLLCVFISHWYGWINKRWVEIHLFENSLINWIIVLLLYNEENTWGLWLLSGLFIVFAFAAITVRWTSNASLEAFTILFLAVRLPTIASLRMSSCFRLPGQIRIQLEQLDSFKRKRVAVYYLLLSMLSLMKVLLVIVASVALAGLSTNLTESKAFAIHFEALRSLTTASSFRVFMLSLAKERDFLLLIEYHMTRLHICKGWFLLNNCLEGRWLRKLNMLLRCHSLDRLR